MKPSIEIEINGTIRSYPAGITPEEILRENSDRNGYNYLAAELNGHALDLTTPLTDSGRLTFINTQSRKGLDILRHSTSHVMAQAVKELFPDALVTIGPAIETVSITILTLLVRLLRKTSRG